MPVMTMTGHRPKYLAGYNEDKPFYHVLRQAIRSDVVQAIQNGVDVFVAGGAQGGDTIFAEVVLDLKKEYPHIRLMIAIPFPGQEKKWPREAQERYWNIVHQADEHMYVNQGGYAGWKMIARDHWMVDKLDESGMLLALYNGDPTTGTGQTVAYAKERGVKTILRIIPEVIHDIANGKRTMPNFLV